MKLKAVIALALTAFSAQAFSADQSLSSKLQWAVDVSTHIYDVENMESFKPSLEFGVAARLPLTTFELGTVELEGGLSQTLIYASGQLTNVQNFEGYELSTSQIDFRRVFLSIGLETKGQWFLRPQVGVEHITSKLRLYDENAGVGFTTREGDSNAFAALGVGYRFPDGKKGILSFATLADTDDQDYRVTYSASF
ncbi:MAG: hypothetical protein ACPGSC_02800 [Granulosicoccaceae bacterium]